MKPLFFDTETSGLPDWKNDSSGPDQPHIVSLSAMLHDENRQVIHRIDTLIKPRDWVIGEDTIAIHGITNERAHAEGRDIDEVIDEFMVMYEQADILVAHNAPFDKRMIRIETKRRGMPKLEKPTFCTASKSSALCNLEPTFAMVAAGFNNPKTPKLTEAYQVFFGVPLEGAHNAINDMDACARIYYFLRDKGVG